MAIIPKEEGKATPTFAYVILGLIVAAIVLSLAAFFWPVQLTEDMKVSVLSPTDKRLSRLQFNSSVLQNPVFQTLKAYGQFPIAVSEGGRPNPFSGM